MVRPMSHRGVWPGPTLCSLMPPARRSPDTRNCGPDARIPDSELPDAGVARFSGCTGVVVPRGVPACPVAPAIPAQSRMKLFDTSAAVQHAPFCCGRCTMRMPQSHSAVGTPRLGKEWKIEKPDPSPGPILTKSDSHKVWCKSPKQKILCRGKSCGVEDLHSSGCDLTGSCSGGRVGTDGCYRSRPFGGGGLWRHWLHCRSAHCCSWSAYLGFCNKPPFRRTCW